MNIITFEDYELMLSEGAKLQKFNRITKNLFNYALLYFIFFNGLNDTKKLTFKDIVQYTQNMDVRNNDKIVKEALDDVKNKVKEDNRIINKEEVLMQLDSVSIVRKKSDKISRQMYLIANSGAVGNTSSFALTLSKKKYGHDCNIIFLNDDADYNEIVHELSHIVNQYMKKSEDFNITIPFDFNRNYFKQIEYCMNITNGDAEIGSENEKIIEYLSSESEIYSRLSSLKYFLYKRGYIKTPNDNIPKQLFRILMNGKLYEKLSEKDKEIFIKSDFIEILIFVDIDKIDFINHYVDLISKNKDLI